MKNKLKLLILDVDGILTDGKKYYDKTGMPQFKIFCDKDWTTIKRFKAIGVSVVFLTGDPFNETIGIKRNIPVIVNRKDGMKGKTIKCRHGDPHEIIMMSTLYSE